MSQLRAVEVVERQNASCRVRPIHLGHAHTRVPGEVAPEPLRVRRFSLVVELAPNGSSELVDESDSVDESERSYALSDELCGLIQQLEVGLDLLRRIGALHLDDRVCTVGQPRAMNLTDRRRGERRGASNSRNARSIVMLELLLDHLL